MKGLFKWGLRLLVLVALSAGLVVGLKSPLFEVTDVHLEHKGEPSQKDLFDGVKASVAPEMLGYLGQPLWDVDLDSIVDKIKKDKRVSGVEVLRKFPNKIMVEIRPRQPIAMFISGGQAFPVGADGGLLPSVSISSVLDLPIMRGQEFDKKSVRLEVAEMLETLPPSGEFGRSNVSEIVAMAPGEYEWHLSKSESMVKILSEDFKYKASMVLRVLKYLDSKNMRGRVIDARFSKKVVVRLRNRP